MWSYADTRLALRDALRLSEGMTFKAAVAGLAAGRRQGRDRRPLRANGSTASVAARRCWTSARPSTRSSGRYVTAEDVGVTPDDLVVVNEVTPHVSALPRERGGSGDPSPWTALGVLVSIEVACERVFGTADLAGRSVAVMGLGHVGGDLARRLAAAGARLTVTDVDERHRALAAELGATWVEPSAILAADVDVLAPCALGGRPRRTTARPALQARVIAGAANNQLADPDVADVLAAARRAVGARLRRQRRRHRQHRRRAPARAATTRRAPTPTCAASARRSARCSTRPSATAITPLAAAMALAHAALPTRPEGQTAGRSPAAGR